MIFSDQQPEKDIYQVNLAEFDMSGEMVYAPLARKKAFFTVSGEKDEWLQNNSELSFTYPFNARDFGDLTSLTILPTHRCNFNCSYCYSAGGRSHYTLTLDDIKCAVDFFLTTRKSKDKEYRLNILGGGEPLVVPELTMETIQYACEAAEVQGFSLYVELVTNGSLLNEKICEFLARYSVSVGVSFELIPEVQEKLRGVSQPVSDNLALLEKYRIPTIIQSTITPFDVHRMEEMYNTLKSQYPWIKMALFEPVISNGIFPDAKSLKDFYDIYLDGYFNIRKMADADNITIRLRGLNQLNKRSYRGCEGRFCLTPQKQVSICFCTSSPEEERFADMSYGEILDGQVVIDEEKFQSIISRDVNSFPICKNCFARWNCAGGCMLPNHVYTAEQKLEVCRFTRKLYVREFFYHHCTGHLENFLVHYSYRFYKHSLYNNIPTDSYLIDCCWGEKKESVVYQLNFYDIGEGILLTDFFPHQWRNDPDCTRRSASAEGHAVNVRKIVQTCFFIFVKEFARYRPDSVMVIRGNDVDRRNIDNIDSQKTRIYYKILKKMASEFGFETIDMLQENFFFITKNALKSRCDFILPYYKKKLNEKQGKEK